MTFVVSQDTSLRLLSQVVLSAARVFTDAARGDPVANPAVGFFSCVDSGDAGVVNVAGVAFAFGSAASNSHWSFCAQCWFAILSF